MKYFENYEEAQLLGELIEIYYAADGNGVGGNLHIVLDDGNLDDESIKWAFNECLVESDYLGAEIAKRLLGFDEESRGMIMQGSSNKIISRVSWVSAKDRLPDVVGYYCVSLDPSKFGGNREFCVLYFDTDGSRFSVVPIGYELSDRVTHWALLPAVSLLG